MESRDTKSSADSGMDAGMKPSPEFKKIINHPDLEIYWPSRTTVVGFLVAWLFVAIIIIGTMFLARIGA